MKKSLFKAAGLAIIIMFALNGCKKDDPIPDKVAPLVSTGKQIIYFKTVMPAVTGIIDTVNKTISVSVPSGTTLTSLATDISLAAGHTISPASGVAQNFTNPVTYTITRPNKTTTAWIVTVKYADIAVDANITTATIWTSDKTYLVSGDIYVDNTLTIQPGTVIKFAAGASLTFGYYSNTTLIANGTANNPIIFKSTALLPTAGAWEGLYFYDKTLNNTSLAFCNIQHAGGNTDRGAINLYNCDIAINNCNISNSGAFGIYTTYANNKGGFVTFAGNTINTPAKYGIVLDAQKISTIGTGNTFTNAKGVLITGDFRSTTAQIWKNLGLPYIVNSEVDIDGNLTIEAGTTFKFDANGWIVVGYYSTTTFIADGTSTSPITFTSTAIAPTAGAWIGITFYPLTLTNSKMNYCVVDFAGSNAQNGAVNLQGSSIIFTNNTIRNSAAYGILLDEASGFQAFNNNTINTCVKHLISISTKHLPELGVPNTFTAGTGKGIEVSGNVRYTSPVIWKKQTVDFYITGGELDIDGDLTIEAGSKFLFVDDSYFYFGYYATTKVTAIGTASTPILFTSAASSPVAGTWPGFHFASFVMSNSALTYCKFTYSGLNNKPAIYTEKSFPVNNCSILLSGSTNKAEYQTGAAPTGTGNDFTWVEN